MSYNSVAKQQNVANPAEHVTTIHACVMVKIGIFIAFIDWQVQPGADPGFSKGGVRVRGGSKREELTLVLYLCSRGSGGRSPPEAIGY